MLKIFKRIFRPFKKSCQSQNISRINFEQIEQPFKIIDLQEMEELIKMIKSFDTTEAYFSYPFIKNALNEIHFRVPKCIIPKGKKLIRGRVHKNGEDYFTNISDISYNRQTFLIKDFGRANEPCQSIFYCSDNQDTAFIETCTVAREDLDKDSELITWGIWEVTKNIEISYVIGPPSELTENETLNSLTHSFITFLKDVPEPNRNALLLFHDFISKQFQIEARGHHALYKISCAYSNWIYNQNFVGNENSIIESGGIMYRSSLWPKDGMNIALKGEIVDTSLRLIAARRDHIQRQGDLYSGSDTITASSIDIGKDRIFWT